MQHQLDRRAKPPTYTPAFVHYVVIFSPALGHQHAPEDPARVTDQILVYTGRESAVPRAQMIRQVALANALIAFATEMHGSQRSSTRRRVSAGSSMRRLLLVEVERDLWLHACIMLAHVDAGGRATSAQWQSDEWMCRRMCEAWDLWRLRHGSATAMLAGGRRAELESVLERHFSKWAWTLDVEGQHAASVVDAPIRAGLVAETLGVTDAAAGPALDAPVEWFGLATQSMHPRPEVIVVRDDAVLWPTARGAFKREYHALVLHILRQLGGMAAAREYEQTTHRSGAAGAPDALGSTLSGLSRMWSGMASLGEQAAALVQWPQGGSSGEWFSGKAPHAAAPPPAAGDGSESAAAAPDSNAVDVLASLQRQDGQDRAGPRRQASAGGAPFAALHARLAQALEAPPEAPEAHPAPPAAPEAASPTPLAPVEAAPWHDYALDGWGHEDPAPFRSEQLHAADGTRLFVSYTRRGLLTAILVWTAPSDAAAWLAPAWELLRRAQRAVNDAERHTPMRDPAFLHVTVDGLGTNALGGARDATPGTEAALLDAARMAARHGVCEYLARDEQGQFWAAMRDSLQGKTFMVLRDARDANMVMCERELRQLAAHHPEFGL